MVMVAISVAVLFIMLPQQSPPSTVRVDTSAAALARGDYLFNSVLGCPVCHSERNWELVGAPPMEPLGGGRACEPTEGSPVGLSQGSGFPGIVCFRNITPDNETGIGEWSDGEILRAIREGVDRDGHALFPTMPYTIYAALSDEDAQAVVAYLRTLPPVQRPLPDTEINFPVNLIVRFVPRPLRKAVRSVNQNDSVAYGDYLAEVARCKFCHTPRSTRNRLPYKGQEYAGGVEFVGLEGFFYSTNLTPHPEGLGDMSRAEFLEVFRSRKGGVQGEVNIMPWTYFASMTDEDLGAIYDYLMTLPAKPTYREDATL